MTEPVAVQAPAGEPDELAEAGPPELEAADATFTRQRFIPTVTREWVLEADGIMLEYGAVVGRTVLDKRYKARWRAQRLIKLMVELRLHERWELQEHTEFAHGGWKWLVEYKGK